MMKKILMVALVLMMLMTSTAMAEEQIPAGDPELTGVIAETVMVEPRFTYIGYVTVGLEIDANGRIVYGGSACAPYRNMRITVHLQRSNNGLFWDEIFSHIQTGYDSVGLEESMYVTEGNKYYRAKVIVDVFDANRNIIETTTVYSSEEQY